MEIMFYLTSNKFVQKADQTRFLGELSIHLLPYSHKPKKARLAQHPA